MSLKSWILQTLKSLLLPLTFTFKSTKLYNKRDDFTLRIVNFPLISNNIPTSPAYGVNISKCRPLSRPFHQYRDFQNRAQLLTQNLLKQGYAAPRLK